MSRFRREDAPSLVRTARGDASLTQAELAGMTGMSQSTLAQIESGRRAVSAELLERILRAADYRPSVPLARYAPSINSYAEERGLGDLRVFGSVARGTDGFESDIDLIGTPTRELSLFDLADIASYVSELTGFPTEVHADTHVPDALRGAIAEAAPPMSGSTPFTSRPRTSRRTPSFDAENFLRELDVIAHRIDRVAATPVEAFNADCPGYDSACMVIIRLAAFLERNEYALYMDVLAAAEKRALRTTRNIAAHSGYQSMDDELLWTAVTRNVPNMIERLRAAASGG